MNVATTGGILTEAQELLKHRNAASTRVHARADLGSLRTLVGAFGRCRDELQNDPDVYWIQRRVSARADRIPVVAVLLVRNPRERAPPAAINPRDGIR